MRHRMLFAAVVAGLLMLPRASAAQIPSPLLGTWKADLGKSVYPGAPPFKKMTLRIEPLGDELQVVYDVIGPRGGVTHLEWTGKPDGRDYPVQGIEDVVTNAYRRVDDFSYEVVQKVDGDVVLTATMKVSPDGRTLTTTTPNSVAVFDRQ